MPAQSPEPTTPTELARWRKFGDKVRCLAVGKGDAFHICIELMKEANRLCAVADGDPEPASQDGQALSQAYYLITGKSPAWSDTFGHAEAIEEIDDAQRLLRQRIKELERVMRAAERVQDASGAGMDAALNGLFEALTGARKS